MEGFHFSALQSIYDRWLLYTMLLPLLLLLYNIYYVSTVVRGPSPVHTSRGAIDAVTLLIIIIIIFCGRHSKVVDIQN